MKRQDGLRRPQLNQHSHVVLNEPLDFVAGEFVLCEFDGAVFKLVAEAWWAEQDDSSVNQQRKGLLIPRLLHQQEISYLCD